MATFVKNINPAKPWQFKKSVYKLKNGKFVLMSSIEIYQGFEMMVFECDKNGEVENWSELLCIQSVSNDFDFEKIINEFEAKNN